MGLAFDTTNGQTLLDEEERNGLLIPTIATRGELNEFEQQNIEQAVQWTLQNAFTPERLFTEEFVRLLHRRMFSDVWAWSGQFRKTNKNIGIDWRLIPTELKKLLDDARYWYHNNTYPPDELALRFKHRIISIHCFPNGNGRHSRLFADIIISKIFEKPVFTWGAAIQNADTDARAAYLKAVKAADNGNYRQLAAFARS